MRKLIALATLLTFLLPLSLAAVDNDIIGESGRFPLDKGRSLVYDDKTVESIISFHRVDNSDIVSVNVFQFDSYRGFPRHFYGSEGKILEWTTLGWRVWYDFNASPGDSWQMVWRLGNADDDGDAEKEVNGSNEEPGSGNRDSDAWNLRDVLESSTVTLVANDESVSVPAGDFDTAWHFRTTYDDGADSISVTIDEWFAEGYGCIRRTWTTAFGVREQNLARLIRPLATKLRMDVTLGSDIYKEGEDIDIEVSVLNWSDMSVTRTFPTSLQVDYFIDDTYQWSSNHAFTEAETSVTFPPREVVKWKFTHTSEDFPVPPGMHVISAELVGTDLRAKQLFSVQAVRDSLPEGLALEVATGKETYGPGETIDFTLTATNTTESDITIDIIAEQPIFYTINGRSFPDPLKSLLPIEKTEITIPAGGSESWEDEHSADRWFLPAGEYRLAAGLWGYIGTDDTTFTVARDFVPGTVSGTVFTYDMNAESADDTPDKILLADATVFMHVIMPRAYEKDLLDYAIDIDNRWEAVTGEDGRFTFTDVPVGAYYMLSVRLEGYYPFQKTLRVLEEETDIDIALKPQLAHPQYPLNFKRRLMAGLLLSFGTDRSVYQPDSGFKAVLNLRNTTSDSAHFTFTKDQYMHWAILDSAGTVLWEKMEEPVDPDGAAWELLLAPGESVEFVREGTFDGVVPADGGKYMVRGTLLFDETSVPGIDPGGLTSFVKVLILPEDDIVNDQCIEARAHMKEFVVDLRDSLRAYIDIAMRPDSLSGEITVSEILRNMHKPLTRHRFHRMIEIDADSRVRAGLDSALVRVYFDPDEVVDPKQLVLAHWSDNVAWDPGDFDDADPKDMVGWGDDDNKDLDPAVLDPSSGVNWDPAAIDPEGSEDWELLETRVDLANGYAEAYTNSFSSFALFEATDDPVAVDEEAVPEVFELGQNWPNPFNPATLISFAIPEAGHVSLTVYNMLGQEVTRLVDRELAPGTHHVMFDGASLASGIYFYRIKAADFIETRKMLLMK